MQADDERMGPNEESSRRKSVPRSETNNSFTAEENILAPCQEEDGSKSAVPRQLTPENTLERNGQDHCHSLSKLDDDKNAYIPASAMIESPNSHDDTVRNTEMNSFDVDEGNVKPAPDLEHSKHQAQPVIDLVKEAHDQEHSTESMTVSLEPDAKRAKTSENVVSESNPVHSGNHAADPSSSSTYAPPAVPQHHPPNTQQASSVSQPRYFHVTWDTSWKQMFPTTHRQGNNAAASSSGAKVYRLSILNVNQFTISGLPPRFDVPPTSLTGLGPVIRKISRTHGKAEFDRTNGKWRIPLGAYQALYGYLTKDSSTKVFGIPQRQLQITSLERARQVKGHPSVEELVQKGVPKNIAKSLAPFQRSGVDFVVHKNGRALIADEMGLGKTIQSIASMAVYMDEWPLLILSPSGARYHWESELTNWLCETQSTDDSPDLNVLKPDEILVLSSSKDTLIPHHGIKVVICSYGLAPNLVDAGALKAGMFRCAIVDESHMLKNKASKRTSKLLPILRATNRCILLSGTPAFSRPSELWPQIEILSTMASNLWGDEVDFYDKYVRGGGSTEKAELHTMLTATIMIRRLKSDILKDLPKKIREKAFLNLLTDDQKENFRSLMLKLRQGKGVLGEIARKQYAESCANGNVEQVPSGKPEEPLSSSEESNAINTLNSEYVLRLNQQRANIPNLLLPYQGQVPDSQIQNIALQLEANIRTKLDGWYQQEVASIRSKVEEKENSRTSILSELYTQTGECKIPLVMDMLNRWLRDSTKGKLCIFAHHLSVLNRLQDKSELSTQSDSFIRIDGSTSPLDRQKQINRFQNDPGCRIALLGITAAGVAVTLTAASTVWFAELFWTPAIMIQAEDRCHRIGQQARVRCLYFVAKGTLDEVLWKLVEKKFQDLGEFVEGKERHRIVVDTVYENKHDLYTQFSDCEPESDEQEEGDDANIDFEFDPEILRDIEQLGHEEEELLNSIPSNEDEGDDTAVLTNSDKKVAARIDVTQSAPENESARIGSSAEAAIVLHDDEPGEEQQESTNSRPAPYQAESKDCPKFDYDSYTKWKVYEVLVAGPNLGVSLLNFSGRIVVSQSSISKPAVGDVLIGFNGIKIPFGSTLQQVVGGIRQALHTGSSTRLVFGEDPSFAEYFAKYLTYVISVTPCHTGTKTGQKSKEVIDLIDDDE